MTILTQSLPFLALLSTLASVAPAHAQKTGAATGSGVGASQGTVPVIRRIVVGSPITAIAFSPNGELVAAVDERGDATIWRVSDTTRVGAWRAHDGGATCIAYSPDGRYLVTAGEDHFVVLWNAVTFQRIRQQRGTASVHRMSFSSDGRSLASVGADERVRIWNIEADTVFTARAPLAGSVTGVFFSASGRSLIIVGTSSRFNLGSGFPTTLVVYDLSRGVQQGTPREGTPFQEAVATHTVVTTTRNSAGQVLGVQRSLTCTSCGALSLLAAAVSPYSNVAALAGRADRIGLWPGDDAGSGPATVTLTGHAGGIVALAFSSDGGLLASAGADHSVRLWPVPSISRIANITTSPPRTWDLERENWQRDDIVALAFSPVEDLLASASKDGSILLVDASLAEQMISMSPEFEWQRLVRSVPGSRRRMLPDTSRACLQSVTLPDSFVIRSNRGGARRLQTLGRTWTVGGDATIPSDSLRADVTVKAIRTLCGATGHVESLLVERLGWYLALDTALLSVVNDTGGITPGTVYARNSVGAIAPLMLNPACVNSCQSGVVDAASVAAGRHATYKHAVNARQQALADSLRRVAAAQADSLRRAAADSAAARRETLVRRLRAAGATEEQVRAGLAGTVTPGMTTRMVQAILGSPSRESRVTTQVGTLVRWEYLDTVVDMMDGRVTAVR